jgi:hypothetical protein
MKGGWVGAGWPSGFRKDVRFKECLLSMGLYCIEIGSTQETHHMPLLKRLHLFSRGADPNISLKRNTSGSCAQGD